MNSVQQVKVYFNNGFSCQRPWHVAGMEGKAIADDHGHFTTAETAIMHAVKLARSLQTPLIVPHWLQPLATELAAARCEVR